MSKVPSPSPADRTQKRLLHCVLFTFFVSGVTSQPLGSFIPFLRQAYGFRYELSGILLSCQSAGNLLAVLLAGILPGILGRRRSILVTAVWMAVGYLIFLSGLGAAGMLMAAFLMTGIARGGNSNFSNTMISTLPGEESSRGYNLLHGCYAVGALLSPLALVLCVRLRPDTGWRVLAALLCLLAVSQLAVYAKMPLPPEEPKRGGRAIDHDFLREKRFWLSSAMLFFYASAEYAIVGWLVTYFQDAGILGANLSQMMNSLLWLVIFLGRMAGAALSGRISRYKLLLFDGCALPAFFLLLLFGRSTPLIILGLVGVGLSMSTIYPTALSFGSDSIRGNDFGCSILIITGCTGGLIAPALVGFAAEWGGIRAGMGLIAVFSVLLLLSILLSVRMIGTAS